VAGYLFVDAALPHPGRSRLDAMPALFADQLRELARDGWLPAWPEWFGPEAMQELIPDSGLRAAFIAGCPPLPMALFEEPMPEAPGWPDAPCAYLRLSEAYDDAANDAEANAWPVARLGGHHLSMLTDPEPASMAITGLLARLAE
jgi:hypothetical protein